MIEQGIRAGFRSNKLFDAQLYTEYLDVSRFWRRIRPARDSGV
jgi:hypothetical protein